MRARDELLAAWTAAAVVSLPWGESNVTLDDGRTVSARSLIGDVFAWADTHRLLATPRPTGVPDTAEAEDAAAALADLGDHPRYAAADGWRVLLTSESALEHARVVAEKRAATRVTQQDVGALYEALRRYQRAHRHAGG